jgi:hypothetical protein
MVRAAAECLSTLPHHVQLPTPALERGHVRERRLGDVVQRLPREEALMRGDDHVREGEQPHEDVVLDHDLRARELALIVGRDR